MKCLRRQQGQARQWLGLVLGITLVIATASSTQAQESRGSITGRIVDTSGAVLPGVTVTVVNTQTNSTSTAVTDRNGQFSALYLNPSVYTVTAELMSHAAPEAIVMHCLPAYRGKEIDADVIDGPQSVIWDEAENRRHAQKAIITWLLEQG